MPFPWDNWPGGTRVNKSAYACASILGLMGVAGDLYMWTFTRPDYIADPRIAARAWSRLQRDLRRSLGFRGVRVFELHPGGHGLHVHVVVEGRYDINEIERLCILHGWGRKGAGLDVRAVDGPGAVYYVTKYLKPSRLQGGGLVMPRGVRLWASFGLPAERRVRVRDVSVEGPRADAYKVAAACIPIPPDASSIEKRARRFSIILSSRIVYALGLHLLCRGDSQGALAILRHILLESHSDFEDCQYGQVFLAARAWAFRLRSAVVSGFIGGEQGELFAI